MLHNDVASKSLQVQQKAVASEDEPYPMEPIASSIRQCIVATRH